MKRFIASAAVAALITTSLSMPMAAASAQTVTAQGGVLTLDKGAPITLAVTSEVNSSTHKAGDTFQLTVLNDVKVGDTVVIPSGTPGTAEITWRTGKGAFGKSGKMEFSLVSIDHKDGRIPVTGTFRQEGEGNTIATGVGVIAIGIFAGFITGKRARLPAGRELLSQIAQPVEFTADGHIARSFNSDAAMAAAEAASPIGQCKANAETIENEKKRKKAMEKCYDTKRLE